MDAGTEIPTKRRRRKILLGTLFAVTILFGGWLYQAKTHHDLNLQLLGAVKKNDTEAVRTLLARGADPNVRDVPPNRSSLWEQIKFVFDRSDQAQDQRRYQASISSEDQQPTALFLAIEPWIHRDDVADSYNRENVPLVKALLDSGARVEDSFYGHVTPLIGAVSFGRLQTAQLLLDHGANPLARDDQGQLPIHMVNDLKITELLVINGNGVNAVDNDGTTPLMNVTDYIEIVRFLVEHGAKVNVRAKDGSSALLRATTGDKSKSTQLLLDHGAEVNVCDKEGVTPLHNAADGGPIQNVKMLLDHSAKIDPIDSDGDTPLTTCLQDDNHPDIVKVLIEHGADINHRNKAGQTALSLAKKSNYKAIIKLLLAAGAKR